MYAAGNNATEVRTLALRHDAGETEVRSYRVYSTLEDWMYAYDLRGRFEVVRSVEAVPDWVEAKFPPEALRNGILLVTVVFMDEPYSVVRRVRRGASTEYVKYFSSAAEGYREAKIHEFMHSRFQDNVVAVIESGTVGTLRGAGKRVPPPCLASDCPDIEFYLVTADVGPDFVSASKDYAVDGDDVASYVKNILRLLLDMRVTAGFTHWDLHGNNFFYNKRTGTFRLIDFGFATLHTESRSDSGTCLDVNNLSVPNQALQDFDGDMDIFGFYYDVGRVMLHSCVAVRNELFSIHRTSKDEFVDGYTRIIAGRDGTGTRPRRSNMKVRLDIDRFYVARFALEACMEYPWLPTTADKILNGPKGRPVPRLLPGSTSQTDPHAKPEPRLKRRAEEPWSKRRAEEPWNKRRAEEPWNKRRAEEPWNKRRAEEPCNKRRIRPERID